MKLSRLLVIPAALLGLASIVGCGSTSTGNPFRGDWSGSYTGTNPDNSQQVGTLSLTVTSAGIVTGTLVNTTLGVSGAVTGTISSGGALTSTFTIGGVNGTSDLNGTLVLTNGIATGTLAQSGAAGSASIAVNLSPTT
jgi:hypothetical protein